MIPESELRHEAMTTTWEDFDPWHEAFIWCDSEGVPQRTPFSNGEDLFNDIKDYERDVLRTVRNELEELAFAV